LSHNGRRGHSWLLLRAGYGNFWAMGFHRRHMANWMHWGLPSSLPREISSEAGKLEI
jgi:hypothetical protein